MPRERVHRVARIVYLGVNVACVLVVTSAALRVTRQMGIEERTVPDSIDGMTFFGRALPGFLVGLLANLAWAVWAVVPWVRRRHSREVLWLGIAVAIWVAAWAATLLSDRLMTGGR